ncbi:prephenate dehydratase [Stieleria varia]|uniref:prephenate dehydratase n=1 Tax=Stieleria varia TaxID=2528005 RepID=A0A5C6AVX3_9BACT|nr:prephenate dehydratase [Stieleria varia]TWU02284.1 Prephenate dehydratase [Stieleria varia]
MTTNDRTHSEEERQGEDVDAQVSIDSIDHQLAQWMIRRARMVAQQPDRETTQAEFSRIEALAAECSQTGVLDRPMISETLKHIASACRAAVDSQYVSFLGPQYSYSHLAAMKYFGEGANFAPVATIAAVFESVHRGDSRSGLVPIENSTDGRVVDTLGMFVRRHMRICGEVLLPIHHNLLSLSPREEIREVQSKPQALSQCRMWLAGNLPQAKLVEVSSTTAAAMHAADTPGVAAVASLPAGRKYGLNVIGENIEDNANNVTRFAVLGTDEPEPTGNDKTSILFQVPHRPGALAEVMTIFRDQSLNLTWIESFPSPQSRSEYLFFVELTGHIRHKSVLHAVESLRGQTTRLEVLGSYPIALLDEEAG